MVACRWTWLAARVLKESWVRGTPAMALGVICYGVSTIPTRNDSFEEAK